MSKWSVRFHYDYVDEYEVEAESNDEAYRLANAYDYAKDTPAGVTPELANAVTVVELHVYVDRTDVCVNELDEDGNLLD